MLSDFGFLSKASDVYGRSKGVNNDVYLRRTADICSQSRLMQEN
jgi:hypothetical protein